MADGTTDLLCGLDCAVTAAVQIEHQLRIPVPKLLLAAVQVMSKSQQSSGEFVLFLMRLRVVGRKR